MSSHNSSYAFSSSSTYSYSSSTSASHNTASHTQSYTLESHGNSRDGTQTRRTYSETGKPTLEELSYTDSSGRQIAASGEGAGQEQGRVQSGGRQIEDVTDTNDEEQRALDKEYEDRMEDEYAKREGGT
jgi:hypothetical protein